MATQIEDAQAQTQEAPGGAFAMPKPQAEHAWLQKLVGEWTYEMESDCGPDGKPVKVTGTESVRAIGGFWIVGESTGVGPDGSPATNILTLGYDPQKGHYVGTWFSTMMSFLWVYEGTMDADQRVLTLASDGPSFEVEGKMAQYRDIITIINDDERLLTGNFLGEDGQWHEMMSFRRAS
jgi:hypothetical protein